MSGPDRLQQPVETTASVGARPAEVRRAGDDTLVASGQVRLWHVAGHPEGWRST